MKINLQLDLATVTVRYQKLLERIPYLAWLMTEQGEIITFNQLWYQYLGQSSGNALREILHEEERDRFLEQWDKAKKNQKPLEIKLQLQSLLGHWEWFKVELEPDSDELGQMTWIGTATRLGSEAAISGQQQSVQFLAALLNHASDGIVACNAEGELVLFNRMAQAFHGLPPEPIDPEEWANYYDLYDRDGLKVLTKSEIPLFRALQGEAVVSQEMMIKSKAGGDRSLLANGTAIYSPTGEKLGAVALMRDITDYRQSERLLIALQVAKTGAWNWDLVHQKIFWTREFEILFDYEPETTQQVYSEWIERLHPDDREHSETALQSAIDRTLPEYRCEYRIVHRNGQIRWIDAIGELYTDEQGNMRLSGLVHDITERKQAEIALQTSEELFRHTFEHTPVGFAQVKLDGSLLRVNQKFCEIVGYSKTELLTTTFQKITEPADLEEDLALVEQLLNDEIREYTLEKRYIHKQGHHVWVSLTASLVREIAPAGQIGTPQYFLAAIKDITERKHLELLNQAQTADLQCLNNTLMLTQQQLEERNQELDSFVHTVSHDLKAPLRSIANLSEWIEDDLSGQISEDNQKQFQLLRQRVSRMDALVDGLLRYSRVGRQELPIEPVDVAQLLAETIDSLDPPASFKIKILSPLPTLNTKRILLGQTFANLLSNAIKHHHRATGHVEISVEDEGDRYQFSIADDGPGIPTRKGRERIFEIFQTLQPHSAGTNTGIGLALVKKIVEGEGGRIWLEENNKEGACFCFTWPKIDQQ